MSKRPHLKGPLYQTVLAQSAVQRAIVLLCAICPFFIGPIINPVPLAAGFIEPFVERYSYFLLIFILWSPLVAMALRMRKFLAPEGAQAGHRRVVPLKDWVLLIAIVVLSLVCLGFVRAKLPLDVFYSITFSLGCVALGKSTAAISRPFFAIIGDFLAAAAIGYTSFLLTNFNWTWQPVLVCIGLACIVSAEKMAQRLTIGELPATPTNIRIQLVLLSAGPACFAALCYLGQLERPYLAVLLTLFWTERLIRISGSFAPDKSLPAAWLHETRGIAGLFIVITLVLALV